MKAPAIKTGRRRETRYHYFWMIGASARRSARSASVASAVVVGVLWFACANAVAFPATAFAQAGAAPSGGSSTGTGAPTPIALPATISPTITEAPDESARPTPPRRPHKRKAPRKTPNWVVQSKAQLALGADPRFKNVHASITQPGVIVLDGEVFDDVAKGAAEQTVARVQGVERVINALMPGGFNHYEQRISEMAIDAKPHQSDAAAEWLCAGEREGYRQDRFSQRPGRQRRRQGSSGIGGQVGGAGYDYRHEPDRS